MTHPHPPTTRPSNFPGQKRRSHLPLTYSHPVLGPFNITCHLWLLPPPAFHLNAPRLAQPPPLFTWQSVCHRCQPSASSTKKSSSTLQGSLLTFRSHHSAQPLKGFRSDRLTARSSALAQGILSLAPQLPPTPAPALSWQQLWTPRQQGVPRLLLLPAQGRKNPLCLKTQTSSSGSPPGPSSGRMLRSRPRATTPPPPGKLACSVCSCVLLQEGSFTHMVDSWLPGHGPRPRTLSASGLQLLSSLKTDTTLYLFPFTSGFSTQVSEPHYRLRDVTKRTSPCPQALTNLAFCPGKTGSEQVGLERSMKIPGSGKYFT